MAILYNWRHRNFREVHKRYTVDGGAHAAKADTLEEAKRAGERLAKMNAWRGKWNVMWVVIRVLKQDAPSSIFYRPTAWKMYVPVRGSGARANRIVEEIKRRHGVAPMKWTRR